MASKLKKRKGAQLVAFKNTKGSKRTNPKSSSGTKKKKKSFSHWNGPEPNYVPVEVKGKTIRAKQAIGGSGYTTSIQANTREELQRRVNQCMSDAEKHGMEAEVLSMQQSPAGGWEAVVRAHNWNPIKAVGSAARKAGTWIEEKVEDPEDLQQERGERQEDSSTRSEDKELAEDRKKRKKLEREFDKIHEVAMRYGIDPELPPETIEQQRIKPSSRGRFKPVVELRKAISDTKLAEAKAKSAELDAETARLENLKSEQKLRVLKRKNSLIHQTAAELERGLAHGASKSAKGSIGRKTDLVKGGKAFLGSPKLSSTGINPSIYNFTGLGRMSAGFSPKMSGGIRPLPIGVKTSIYGGLKPLPVGIPTKVIGGIKPISLSAGQTSFSQLMIPPVKKKGAKNA